MDSKYLQDEDGPKEVADPRVTYQLSAVPTELEAYFDFVDISEDGYTILGTSNLCGRYWKGSVWFYKNASLGPAKDKSCTGVQCESTVCDGKFIDGNKTVVVGEDSGAVTIFTVNEDEEKHRTFESKSTRNDHDNSVLTVSVSADKNNVITAGADSCIKVWDMQELVPIHSYSYAHSHFVTGTAFITYQSQVFASCSLDGTAVLWDVRQSKPATVLVDDQHMGLTALAWQSGDVDTLIVGSDTGLISMLDIRSIKTVKQSTPFVQSIYRMLSVEPSVLAVCADSHEVKIIDPLAENSAIRYVDGRHTDFVRGLSYDKNSGLLYSCGWDQQLISHSIEML